MKNYIGTDLMRKIGTILLAFLLIATLYFPISADTDESNLQTYIENHGGEFSLLLFDGDGNKLNNGDTAKLDEDYEVVMSFTAPEGILPGTYTTTIPATGFNFAAANGQYKTDNGTVLGTWAIGNNGVITSEFNENANNYTNSIVNASFMIHSDKNATTLSFNNEIFVIYKAPSTGDGKIQGSKRMDGVDSNGNVVTGNDYDRIITSGYFDCYRGNTLAGKKIVDTITTPNTMYFSQEDQNVGIYLTFLYNGVNHELRIPDNQITWTSTSWTYTFPNVLDGVDLRNVEGDVLRVNYYYMVTVKPESKQQTMVTHSNKIDLVDNNEVVFTTSTNLYQNNGIGVGQYSIDKSHERNGNNVTWHINGTLMGATPGVDKIYNVGFTDHLYVRNKYTTAWKQIEFRDLPDDIAEKMEAAISTMKVTISYKGETYEVPALANAGADDLFAYTVTSGAVYDVTPDEDGSNGNGGEKYAFQFKFYMRCNCTEDLCTSWYNECYMDRQGDFCACWQADKEVAFDVEYTLDATSIENKWGDGNIMVNRAIYNIPYHSSLGVVEDVPLGQVLSKDLIDAPKVENGYTASYKINVNKDFADLSQYDTITLRDTMSETLAYIPGTMKISAKTASGETISVDYDMERPAPNLLLIKLNTKGPYTYVIEYDAQIVITGSSATVDYKNAVSLTIDGETYKKEDSERTLAKIEFSAQRFGFTLEKTDKDNSTVYIPNATYGLYTKSGELIKTSQTDANGQITFETNVREGVILKDHTAYYVKEIEAPEGYKLDTQKHWLYFCTNATMDAADNEFDQSYLRLPSLNGNNSTVKMKVTDERKAGNLTVTKSVAGNAANKDKAFNFTVTLSDNTISGSYGNMTFNRGVATFTLKDGESKTAEGLPNGVTYTVTEDDYTSAGYVTTKSGDEGVIAGNNTLTAAFINTRNATGSLTISKALDGNDVDSDKEFIFTVTLNDTTINKSFSGVSFTNGIATLKLKGGQSKAIEGLPHGVGYTVTEADYRADGYIVSKTGERGTISETKAMVAAFTNTRNTYGNLTVTKAVAGNAADTDKKFNFTVTLSDNTIAGNFGDMTFVGGVATFTLKDGGSKTAEGLPNGVTYTVTEDDYTGAGYVTTKSGDEGTIVGGDTLISDFTNTRNATGTLTISKDLDGNDVDTDKEFTFTITLTDSTINQTFSGVSFTGGVATIKLKGGQNKVIAGLPNGVGYTVTEADYRADGYAVSKTGDSGTISETKAMVAAFTNTRNTYGDLTVTKSVAGNAADTDKEFNFTVTLSDSTIAGNFGDMTFVGGVATFTLKDGQSKTAEDLPNGVGYTVTEDDYTGTGYVTAKSGDEGVIVGDNTLTAAFTNARNATGSLTISKALDGNDVDTDKEFNFTITLNDNTINKSFSGVNFTNGVATIKLKGGQNKVIEGLPNGVGYTVTEADYRADGYSVSKTGEQGTISETKAMVAAFTNTRNTYGDLTVEKSVAGNAADSDKEFSFTVTLGNNTISGTYGDMTFVGGVATFTLKDGESKTAEDLPNGVTYEVTESDYTGEGYITTKEGNEGTIGGNETIEASFTNTRNAEGTLTIAKVLEGNDTDSNKEFTFTVTLSDNTINKSFSGVSFTGGVATITLKGGQSKVISGLPNGVGYTVTEADYSKDGYTVSKTGEQGTISETKAMVAAFTNTRNTYGDLTVSKSVAGNAADTGKEFNFTVTLSDSTIAGNFGDMTFVGGVATFTLKDGQSKTAEDLPNGVTYAVAEDDYTGDGYFVTKDGTEGTIVGDDSVSASFINTRNAEGSLTITKILDGNDTDSNKDFSFTITLSDNTLNKSFSGVNFTDGVATITLKGGQNKVIEGLPNGIGHTVTEADYSKDGYTASKTGDSGNISETTPSAATFTNTRNTYGNLTVTKAVAGNAADTSKKFNFTVALTDRTISGEYGDMTFDAGIANFTLKHGDSITAEGLPNGVGYTVLEDDYTKDGYVTAKINYKGLIDGDNTVSALFTNTRDAEGSLEINKKLEGNDVDTDKDFEFTVTLSDDTINGDFSGVAFADGVATVTLKGGQSKVIEGLPNGVGYTVTEKDYSKDGYAVSKTGDSGTISENKTSVSNFTNTRNTYGDLMVTKAVAGNAANANKEFSFTVTLTDTTISGDYGDMTFVDGVATFTLIHGGSKTAQGLPNGVGYTVIEEDYTDDGYVSTMTGDEGIIVGNDTLTAEFTNTRNAEGSLTIVKTLKGNDVDKKKAFTFTLTLSDDTINETFSGVVFTNGVAKVSLKGGQSKVIEGLPNGVGYTVTEADYSKDGYTVTKKGDTGTISETKARVAAFTNTRNTYGNLTVSKTVTGKTVDKNKQFSFTIKLSNTSISGKYGNMTFKNGVATFTLKHDQSKTAKGLPNGVTYIVSEKDYGREGYVTTKSGDKGTIVGGNTQRTKFTNDLRNIPPDRPLVPDDPNKPNKPNNPDKPNTGDSTNMTLLLILFALSSLGVVASIGGKKKNNR